MIQWITIILLVIAVFGSPHLAYVTLLWTAGICIGSIVLVVTLFLTKDHWDRY